MADADAPPSPPPSAMQPPSNASPPPPPSPPAYAPTSDATPAAAKTPNLPDTPASAYPDTPFSDADASVVASSDAAADAPGDAEDDGINASGARKHMTLAPPAPPSKKSKKKNNSNSVWTRPASRKGKKKAKQPAQAPSGANGSRHPKPKPSCGEDEFLPPTAAAGVTATVDFSPAATDLGGVHLLPCGIRHNSAAAVSDYFKSRDTGVEVDGVRVEEAFVRGRKLQGATLALPDGHRGYVLEKKSGGKDMQSLDGEVSNFVSRAEFQNITYWNHDTMPSAEDPLPRCFHWLTIANATAVVKGLQRCKGRDWFDYISALPLSELGLPFMSFDEVITVNSDDLILEAFKCMKDNKIGGMPVVEGPKRKLVGSVSIRDIRFLLLRPDLFSNFRQLTVLEFMKTLGSTLPDSENNGLVKPPLTCAPDASLGTVIDSIASRITHRIYVVDGEFEVIGVVTLRDVISCFIHEPPGYCDNYLASAMEKLEGKGTGSVEKN